MPLLRGLSKRVFHRNVAVERAAGKPVRQAVAIAYSMKHRGYKSNTTRRKGLLG